MNRNKYVDDLKKRLVGKTIVDIQRSNYSEAICKFVTSDGKSFRLHATDIDIWSEDDVDENGLYSNLDSLCKAVENFRYINYVRSSLYLPAKVEVKNDLFIVDAFDGSLFKMNIKMATDELEIKILNHPKLLDFIGHVVVYGDVWKTLFDKNIHPLVDNSFIPKDLLKDI